MQREVRAGVTVDVGEPQHTSSRECVRRVLARVERLVPQRIARRDSGREIHGRGGGDGRHPEHSEVGLGAGVCPGSVGGCRRSRRQVGGTDYHVPIIYRSIEKSKSEPVLEIKRGPGRPRATNRAPAVDTREAILDTAAQLFASKGYAATRNARKIAATVGLRQASLFHYFARKEDLFVELLDRTVSPVLAGTAWLMRHPGRPEVRLYALVRQDVTNLIGSRHNLAALQLLPEARDDRFADFWTKRARLRGRYPRSSEKLTPPVRVIDRPIELVTDLVFGAVEATMTWSEGSRRGPAEDTADAVASAGLCAVCSSSHRAAKISERPPTACPASAESARRVFTRRLRGRGCPRRRSP